MACSGEKYIYGTDKTIALTADANEKDKYIYNTLQKAFDDVARDYAKAQGITDEPKLFPQYPIKKYQAGTYMGAHFDQQEGDERLKVSFVMYLNDDYEGGELVTASDPSDAMEHTRIIHSPEKGAIVSFLNTLYHKVNPIIKGKRYTLAVWYDLL